MKFSILVLIIALSGCVAGREAYEAATAPQAATLSPASLSASLWSDYNGTLLSNDVSGNLIFSFPSFPHSINIVTTSALPLTGNLSAKWTIVASTGTVFDFHTNSNNTCPGVATTRLYFQRIGDNWSGVGNMQQYRYFAINTAPLIQGSSSIQTSLNDPSQWIDVLGELGSKHVAEFTAAKVNAGRVGLVFGGGCFAAHGVFVTPPNTAQFDLSEFRMEQ